MRHLALLEVISFGVSGFVRLAVGLLLQLEVFASVQDAVNPVGEDINVLKSSIFVAVCSAGVLGNEEVMLEWCRSCRSDA